MDKLDIFYLKNSTYDKARATWGGAVAFGFLGWIFGGIPASMVDHKLLGWDLGLLSFIFPLLAIIPLVLNYVFKLRYYFLPSLMVLSISLCVSMTLAVLFSLATLYFILPLFSWSVVTALAMLTYYLVWYYNQQKRQLLTRYLMKLYNQDKLNLRSIDPNKYVQSSPEWLSLLGYGMVFIGVLMAGTAFFGGKLDNENTWVLPVVTLSTLTGSLMFQMVSARWCGYIKPTIEVIKNLQVEDKRNNH